MAQVLKFAEAAAKKGSRLDSSLLLIDEGSQMPFPGLMALLTLLAPPPVPTTVIVAGDHRQLPNINEHDFGSEARPGVIEKKTFLSAYDFLLDLSKGEMPKAVVSLLVLCL